MKAMLVVLTFCLAVAAVPATVESHSISCEATNTECVDLCLEHLAETAGQNGHGCAIRRATLP